MTQEDKAKAYDEALGWMREMYPCLTDSLREDAEHYFPELRENEDERIRKELKEAFEAYDIESKWNGIPIRSIFAWLEKQKDAITDITMTEAYKMGLEAGRAQEEAEKFFDSAQSYHEGFVAGQK